jgi:hypothetical protein
MQKTFRPVVVGLAATGLFATGSVLAAPPPVAVHVRGAIQSIQGQVLTVTSVNGPVRVLLPPKVPVVSVIPSDRAHIKDGSFLGIASVPGPGGAQSAREVVVFPEAARGTGEGSYPWDLPGSGGPAVRSRMTNGTAMHSKMTNGTVATSRMTNGMAMHSKMTNGTVRKSVGGTALTLQYKSGTGMGSQTITLPPGIPVVTFVPGKASQLVPGAHVFVAGHRQPNGAVTADRVLVGKDGLVPPM